MSVKNLLYIALAIAALALAAAAIWLTKTVTDTLRGVQLTLEASRATMNELQMQTRVVSENALVLIDKHLTQIQGQVDLLRKDLTIQVDAARNDAFELAQGRVDKIDSILQAAERTVTDMDALIRDARSTMEPWKNLSGALAANSLGTVAAAKVTLGQAAQTMRQVEGATPEIVEAIRQSAYASQQAANSAAETAQNLAVITKPGPKWLRYVSIGATVAVPAAQVAMPFIVAKMQD